MQIDTFIVTALTHPGARLAVELYTHRDQAEKAAADYVGDIVAEYGDADRHPGPRAFNGVWLDGLADRSRYAGHAPVLAFVSLTIA